MMSCIFLVYIELLQEECLRTHPITCVALRSQILRFIWLVFWNSTTNGTMRQFCSEGSLPFSWLLIIELPNKFFSSQPSRWADKRITVTLPSTQAIGLSFLNYGKELKKDMEV